MTPKQIQRIEYAVIFLWGLCPLLWFIPKHLIVGVDLHVPVNVERWTRQLWAWNEIWGTGFEWSIGFSNLIFSGVSAVFSMIFHNLRQLEQVFFIFWFLIPGLSCYQLARELKPEPERWDFRLSMTNFYMFNLYLQALWGGNEAGLGAYAGLPLILAFYLRALKTRQYFRYAFAITLASLILSAASMNLPLLAVALAGWVILVLVYMTQENLWKSAQRLREMVLFSLGTIALMSLCNAFWIIPQFYVNQTKVSMPAFSSEAIATTRSWLSGISSSTSLSNVIRMQGDWTWYQGWYEPYRIYSKAYLVNPLLIFLGWAIPAIILWGAWKGRLRYRPAWILIAVFGVVLGTGVHPPFGVVYSWLVDHLPYFWVFRSPWFKFTLLTCLGYAVLFGQGVVQMRLLLTQALSRRSSKINLAFGSAALLVAICIANMGYAFPVTLGQMHPKPSERTKLKPAHAVFPPYVMETAQWLRSQEGFFRTLLLPAHVNGASVYLWGLGSTAPAIYPFVDRPLLFQGIPTSLDFGTRMVTVFCQALYGPMTNQAAVIARWVGARYILHEKDFEYDYFEDGPNYPLRGDTPEFVAQRLQRQKGIQKERTFGEWDLYRVADPKPRLDVASRVTVVAGGLEAWIPLAESSLISGDRSFIFLDQIEDEMELKTLTKMNRLGMVDSVVCFGAQSEVAQRQIEQQLKSGPKAVSIYQTTDSFAHYVRNDSAVQIPGASVAWVDVNSPVQQDAQGVSWRWMQSFDGDKAVHLILKNTEKEPISVNLQWTVYSTQRDRDLFVYILDDLKKTYKLLADQPQTISLQNVVLRPGETPVRFYTPYQWDTVDGKSVSFAFKEGSFLVGKLTDSGEVWIPKEGSYALKVTPQPIPKTLSSPPVLSINGKAVPLKISSSGDAYITDSGIQSTAGAMHVEIDQTAAGMYYRIGLIQEKSPVPSQNLTSFQYRTISPVEHDAQLDTDHPCLVVFRESYFPFWQARTSSQEWLKDKVIADGIGNGFLVEKPGRYNLKIIYTVQERFWLGLRIALVSIALTFIGWLVCLWRNRS